ncbi:MAG: alpha-L-fucosidase [Bacteroides sp.]|nr:alpha-L-fucosidase [Bacteroides sp.]
MKKTILTAALLCAFLGAQAQEYYEKHVVFPAGATMEQKVDMASRLVPTRQQLEWQQLEFTCFLHFGMNTFTGNEWGDGKEDPAIFNPTELDCEQWVRALKEGGFKMAIITAKHHDGFCLWPTKTTKHSVASSPWKGGKGDVVRELRNACDKYGIKFGVYLSPWDRNAECYGEGEAYNKFFIEQLTELLTNYGEVHEVWFDGANGEGPNGKKQEYDWDAILKTIRKYQPKAVTAVCGDDVRWVGNEGGLGRATEWSATVLTPGVYPQSEAQNAKLGIKAMSKDLGSRELVAKAPELFWYPSEVDVSIRPGWFYHADQDNQVRSLANLVNIYYRSIGCNSVLLLNIPPDKRGLIHDNDVKRIKELTEYIKTTFADNKVEGGNSAWIAKVGATKEYKLKKDALVNTFLIQEDITKGQRVEGFTVEVFTNGAWHHAGEGTTVGYKRLLQLSDCNAEKVRVTITGSRGDANITNIGLFYTQPLVDKGAKVTLSDVSVEGWKTVGMDATAAIDGKQETVWKANALTPLVVDMGKEVEVAGFSYAPTQEEDLTGTIYKYNFYVSPDGKNWTKCDASGEFSNIMHNPVPYFVRFGKKYPARYFKLEPTAEINGKAVTAIGEVGILLK